jgi:hypothetical protein
LNQKTIAFHRQYWAYSGGHQKVRDYLLHTVASGVYVPHLWSENLSKIQARLFMDLPGVTLSDEYQPHKANVAFLAGMDWQAYHPFFDEKQIKLNLIQHIRHGDKKHPLHQFLRHKAIRLCVSEAVKEAIKPYANGPCYTIRMGHDIPTLEEPKVHELYILATKQPLLGKEIFDWATKLGLNVVIHANPVERELVHQTMAQSQVVIVLPNKTEGFFLPGIEAMALADWAVVPDCIASREYCLSYANVSSCALTLSDCIRGIVQARGNLSRWPIRFLQWRGKRICSGYSLAKEQQSYSEILRELEQIW